MEIQLSNKRDQLIIMIDLLDMFNQDSFSNYTKFSKIWSDVQ